MPKYQDGKIYSIRSFQCEKYYIGSTTEKLCRRFQKHKCEYKTNKRTSSSKKIIQYDDCYIELLENFPCNSREELTKREGEWIRENIDDVVNIRIEGRKIQELQKTIKYKNKRKQWREGNKEYVKQINKNYHENNKEKIKQQRKEFRELNKEKIKQQKADYYQLNKDMIKKNRQDKKTNY